MRERLGGAWPGVLAGAALLLAGVALIAAGEWRQARAVDALDSAGGAVIEASVDNLASLNGRLVRVAGRVAVDRPALDREFGVAVETPELTRRVEMVQWREMDDGHGHISYQRNWFDHPIDSTAFRQPERHHNPPFPVHGRSFKGGNPAVEGLLLSTPLRKALPRQVDAAPDFSTLPPNLAASFRLADGKLWTNRHPGSPNIGDLRLSWLQRPLENVSIVAQVQSRVLVPSAALPTPGFVLMVGEVPLAAMLPGRPTLPQAAWWFRIAGLLLACAGAWWLLAASRDRPPSWAWVAAAALVPAGIVGGICWLGTRWPPVGAWWLLAVVSLGLLAIDARFGSQRKET